MTTYDDDFIRLNMITGPATLPIGQFGFEWPPPEYLHLSEDGLKGLDGLKGVHSLPTDEQDAVFVKVRQSEITDEQRADLVYIARGAEYEYMSMVRER